MDNLLVEKAYDGSWNVFGLKGGYLVHQKYMGYSKKDALRRFKKHLKRVF